MQKPVLWKAPSESSWQKVALRQLMEEVLLLPGKKWLHVAGQYRETGKACSVAQKKQLMALLPQWTPALFHPASPGKENYLLQHYIVGILRLPDNSDEASICKLIQNSHLCPQFFYTHPPGNQVVLVFALSAPISTPGQATLLGYILSRKLAGIITQSEEEAKEWCLPPPQPHLPLSLLPGSFAQLNQHAPLVDATRYLETIDKETVAFIQTLSSYEQKPLSAPPSKETVRSIKQRLGLPVRRQGRKRRQIIEPLRKVLPFIEEELRQHGIEIESTAGIRYGMKLRVRTGAQSRACLNIYYSTYGYSVLGSPQSSQDEELMAQARNIIDGILEYLNYLNQLEDEQ